jgi:hypothetical protein
MFILPQKQSSGYISTFIKTGQAKCYKNQKKKTGIAPSGNFAGIRCTSNYINIGFIFYEERRVYLVIYEKDKNSADFF